MWILFPTSKGIPVLRATKGPGQFPELEAQLEKCDILWNRLFRYTAHFSEWAEARRTGMLTEEEQKLLQYTAMTAPWRFKYRPGDVIVINK